MEEDDGVCDGKGEAFGKGFVEGSLPPKTGMEVAEGPAKTVGGDRGGGVGGEEGYLLTWETREVKDER